MDTRRQARRASALGVLAALALACALWAAAPGAARAWADEAASAAGEPVEVSADGAAARIEGVAYAAEAFECARTGSARAIGGVDYGYAYQMPGPDVVTVVNTADVAVLFIPRAVADEFGIDPADEASLAPLKALLVALDDNYAAGVSPLGRQDAWVAFVGDPGGAEGAALIRGDVTFAFGRELAEGRWYATVSGPDAGFDVKAEVAPAQMDTCRLVPADAAVIAGAGGPLDELGAFLAELDWSPLWITLRTSGTAILIVFFLGLAAAYFTMRISSRAQDVFDTLFTIPMVLPPTVCGFLLLMLLGRNTALGQFFIDVGFPLVFSWQATVIAAVVVAFPLMYRSARGAFEALDPNMMDAARTLGWSNPRIFFRLMLPLAWSSIAAGTVLAFARALGEFGCTLFLAGNQLGSTRTIPIAIYFEWMNGNQAATWFWTITLIVFSFVVILFINLWSRHATKYRRSARPDGRSPKPRRNGRRPSGERGAGRPVGGPGARDGRAPATLAAAGDDAGTAAAGPAGEGAR